MNKVRRISKIITLILLILAIGYLFPKITEMLKLDVSAVICYSLYFGVIILLFVLKLLSEGVVRLNKIKDNVEDSEMEGIYQDLLANHKRELNKYKTPLVIKRVIQILLITFICVSVITVEFWEKTNISAQMKNAIMIAVPIAIVLYLVKFKSETNYKKI